MCVGQIRGEDGERTNRNSSGIGIIKRICKAIKDETPPLRKLLRFDETEVVRVVGSGVLEFSLAFVLKEVE